MIASRFKKEKKNFKAQKIFTDRVTPREAYKTSLECLNIKPQEIITYYGKGGIGKSSLLKTIYQQNDSIASDLSCENLHTIFVSLDAYEYGNPTNILTNICAHIHGDCSLFEYALLQYCSKARMSIDEIMKKNNILSSSIVALLNEALSIATASANIPTAILSKCMDLIKDVNFRHKYRDDIEEIATLNEFELYERLPYYLGLCISNAASKGHYHIIFLDSYESYLARHHNSTASVDSESWLQELFLSSDTIRIIIATRDKLSWENSDSEWGYYLNQHLLDSLSPEDSIWFLENVPIDEPHIISAIAKYSAGVPLYLDLCVDIYEADKNQNQIFDISNLKTGSKIIERYIRHLSNKDKFAVKILSILRSFDIDFTTALLNKENINYHEDELLDLFNKSIFSQIDSHKKLWKVDNSVRLHIKEQMDFETQNRIIKNILTCIHEIKSTDNYLQLANILEICIITPAHCPYIMDMLIEELDFYANAGYWNELHSILHDSLSNKNEHLQAIALIQELVWLRRTGQLDAASQLVHSHHVAKETLGTWYYMYRYLAVQIRHLQGFYDESIISYKKLLDEMNIIQSTIPTHIYITVALKYADLLFLKGNFNESLDMTNTLLISNTVHVADQIELYRIKGHIYRFRGEYSQAKLIYSTALELMNNNHLSAYEGKLYTNMTETLCHCNPNESLLWFQKAVEENTAIGNDIELGKAHAAAAIAYAKLEDYTEAEFHAKTSISLAEKTNYKSGKAFALISYIKIYQLQGNTQLANHYHELASALIEEIGVYKYLLETTFNS